MTWPAALPGAALRSLRTAAGRRTLQVALLVGGLFALGFLCGGQASAAEDIPTATVTSGAAPADPADGVRSLTSDAVGRLANPPAAPEGHHRTAPPTEPTGLAHSTDTAGTDTAPQGGPLADVLPQSAGDKVLRPVTEHVVGAVDGKVLQPVGDLVETVTGQLAEGQAQMPPLPSLPSLPGTELPGLPGLPELPGLPALPGETLPGQTPPGSATPRPKPPVTDSPQGDASGRRSGKSAATAAFYGPLSVTGSPTTDTAAKAGGHRAVQGAHAPVRQAPGGDPGGALGNRPTADSGSSRHGDAHAVSLNHRTVVRLVAGAAVRADAFETRDRHRDIPVSPA
ncbi:hypothetical protein [Streptomyces sp. NPDC001536]|uniref:hypothetical protein n=1 Tax=Streptomyces sp. NPDC001536 TaxID=3364583 RepID=UPI00368431E4